MKEVKQLPARAFLLHLTHWDPTWIRRKAHEKPFDLGVATSVVEALAEEQFTHVVVDCADGVEYKSHPEFSRRHTAPMKDLKELAARAHSLGLDVVPKLNFSQSRWHRHNDWMLAPGQLWYEHFDDEAYFETAFDLIDEVVGACQPHRYFHVGMDEDHDRACSQYVDAIGILRAGLRQRGLKTIIWNDTASAVGWRGGFNHVEKSLAAERDLPKDVTHVLWQYTSVPQSDITRIAGLGFELWGAPGKGDPEQVAAFGVAVAQAGGRGLLMTTWRPTRPRMRKEIVDGIRRLGPLYRGGTARDSR